MDLPSELLRLSPGLDSGLPQLHPEQEREHVVTQCVAVRVGCVGHIGQPGCESSLDQIAAEFNATAEHKTEVERLERRRRIDLPDPS